MCGTKTVMLKRYQILFMDEATASVDSQTDSVIQKIICEHFAARKIINIAHRIPTVIDRDKMMVIADVVYVFDTIHFAFLQHQPFD